MKLDESIFGLIAECEYWIGSECFNPKSYDGNTGEEGRYFRYPVTIPIDSTLNTEEKYNINLKSIFSNPEAAKIFDLEITKDTILNMKYKFGSNNLYIGRGIINVLHFLEKRYNIDFNKLEELQKNNKTQ